MEALGSTGVNKSKSYQSRSHRGWPALLAGGSLLLLARGNVCGQEAQRMSTAGSAATTAQQTANSSIGYYNLLWGPTAWRFSSGANLEYNDNTRLTAEHTQDDVIFQPEVNADMHWPVTLKNSLDFTLGAGYSAYLRNSDLDQFFITPGSGLIFDVYVGDVDFNLHDRVSISQTGTVNPGVGGVNQSQETLQNTAGVTAVLPLNHASASVGYDHNNFVSLSNQAAADSSSENFFGNFGVNVLPELVTGIEAGGTLFNYSPTPGSSYVEPGLAQWSTGVFADYKLSDHLSTRVDTGYAATTSDATGTNRVAGNGSGIYAAFSLLHQVNQWVNYTLTAGRSTDAASFGQVQTYYYVRLDPGWNLFEKYTISTPLAWQHGASVVGAGNPDYDQYQAGLTISRRLTKKLSGQIGYQYAQEVSARGGQNYADDIINLNFTYQF